MIYYYSYKNICLKIEYEDSTILSIHFVKKHYKSEQNIFTKKIKREFDNYFKNHSKRINLNYKINGTAFQKKVLKQISKIPYGKTLSYKELSEKSGYKKAYRAIGNVCAKNNLVILIPCHRVVSSKDIGGFSAPISIKRFLLSLEKE